MALFNRLSPEEKAERKRQKEEAALKRKEEERKRREEEAFRATPAGKARTAKEAGRVVFQYLEVLTETKGHAIPMIGAYASDEQGFTGLQSSLGVKGRVLESAIEQIESEGWRMIDAGYVFQQTSAESRDKFLASGQEEAIGGRVLGIYTSRLVEE